MKTANPDFEYDTYGNLIVDNNKGITKISYNHLNLPKKITFENNDYDGTIEYLYDANGTKLKKTVTDNTTNPIAVTTIHYIDGFQYNGNTMDFFPTAEGYVKATHTSGGGIGGGGITYNYVFNYTDHLGNIRLRYAINPANQWLEILEEDHYYPFGLKHKGYNAQNYVFMSLGDGPVQLIPTNPNALETYKYKFLGQERQDEFGLNWDSFKWRNYSPDLGRFWVIDPISENYYFLTTYQFASNNPVWKIEIEGLEGIELSGYDIQNQSTNFNGSQVQRMQTYFSNNARNGGDDCITCHNKGMRILLNDNSVPVGSQADITRSKMQNAGYANETNTVGFTKADGSKAITPAQVDQMDGSVANIAANLSQGHENSVFGVSINDGYHTMTLTVANEQVTVSGPNLNGEPQAGDIVTKTTFTLSDQGTSTTEGKGNLTFDNAKNLDNHLTDYVKGRSGTRTNGGHEYPARIEIHQIKDKDK